MDPRQPGGPVFKTPLQGAWVRELRSHMPCSMAKRKKIHEPSLEKGMASV